MTNPPTPKSTHEVIERHLRKHFGSARIDKFRRLKTALWHHQACIREIEKELEQYEDLTMEERWWI